MDLIRKSLEQIRQQLGALSVSQKLAIGTLVMMVPMVLLLVLLYAGRADMMPLLDQPLPSGKLAQITTYLDARDVPYRVDGDRVVVAIERRAEVLATLQMQELLPEDTSDGFKALLIENRSWYTTESEARQNYDLALQAELGSVISAYPWVRQSTVIISRPRKLGFGATYARPTASVNVVMATGRLDQKKVDALAGFVSGAVAEMRPQDVTVIDAAIGRQWKVRDAEDLIASDHLENVQKQELYYRQKLVDALGYINNVIVAVNVEVDLTRKHTDSYTLDPEKKVELLVRERTNSTETTRGTAGAEPGVRANAGAANTAVGIGGEGGGEKSTTDEAEREFDARVAETREKAFNPGGVPTKISATVNVPRSFFVAIHNRGKGADAPEPTDAELQPTIDDNLKRIRAQVKNLVNAKEDGQVVVDVYPDGVMAAGGGGGALQAGGGVGTWLDAAGGGVLPAMLAVVAVAGALWLLRSATKPPNLPSAQELAGVPPRLRAEDDVLGEVEVSETPLTGMELGEDELRHRTLRDQVSEMIQGNPQEVAAMMKRWMRDEES